MIAQTVQGMHYEFVGMEWAREGKRSILRVYIDTPNGVSLDDCAEVTHQLNGVLDVENVADQAYHLEVSSPGVNRPLFTLEQFERFLQHRVKIKLMEPIAGRTKLTGLLQQVIDGEVVLVVDNESWHVPFSAIKKANLVYQWQSEDFKN